MVSDEFDSQLAQVRQELQQLADSAASADGAPPEGHGEAADGMVLVTAVNGRLTAVELNSQAMRLPSHELAEAFAEAANAALGAHVLASLSDQANLLGHPQEAVTLARAGKRGLPAGESPACLADLHILEARAFASLGEADKASAAIIQAERVFAKVVPGNEPEWARFIDPAYLFGEAAHCFRDLAQPAQIDRFAAESAHAARRQGRTRRGALSHAAMAISDLTRGNIEAAAAKSTHVVELAASVNSSRCLQTVQDLQRRLRPFSHLGEVKAFNLKARDLLGLSATGPLVA